MCLLKEVTSETGCLVLAVATIPVLAVVVPRYSSAADTATGITAVAPVGVTAVTTAVSTSAVSRFAMLHVPFSDTIFLVLDLQQRQIGHRGKDLIYSHHHIQQALPCRLLQPVRLYWITMAVSIHSRVGQSEELSNILTSA